jgi:hypothetical protein
LILKSDIVAETHPAELSNQEAATALVGAIENYGFDVAVNGASFFAAPQSASVLQSRSDASASASEPSFVLPIAATIAGLGLLLVLVLLALRRRKRLLIGPAPGRAAYSSREVSRQAPLFVVN